MSSAIRTNNKHKNDKNINTKDLIIDTGLDILTKKLKGAGTMKSVLTPLAKSVLLPLGLRAVASVTDAAF